MCRIETMEHSNQLQKLYGVGFEYGMFKPAPLTLQLIHEALSPSNMAGVFYVGPDGRGFISFDQVPSKWLTLLHQFPPQPFRVLGIFDDGRTLLIERAIIVYINSTMDAGFATATDASFIHIEGGPTRFRFTAMAISAIVLQRPHTAVSPSRQVKYRLVNAVFWGTEMIPEGRSGRNYRGRFSIRTPRRPWTIVRLPEFTADLESDLKNGLISMLPTATADATVLEEKEIQNTDEEIAAICRLMSMVTGTSSIWVARESWSGDTQTEVCFASRSVSTDAAGKSRYDVISNLDPGNGLTSFLETTIANFLTLQESLRLHQVIDFLEQARHQKVVHVQLAVEVLALELLSHAWCLKDGLTEQQLSSMHIEGKLGRMRKSFSFIEKGFTNDILRRDIRNPLIHSGQIPLLSRSQVESWTDDLYLLALRLLFCILGYRGNYRDFSKNFMMVNAPIP